MDVRFDMVYDAILQRLAVSQNGTPVSSYSQFARCSGQPFLNWYEKLPQYCLFEANSGYTVTLESSPIFVKILRRIFEKDPNCHGVRIKTRIISESHRMRWADELLEASGLSVPPICVPVSVRRRDVRLTLSPLLAQMDALGAVWCFPDLKRLEIILRVGDTASPAASILAGEQGLVSLSQGNYPAAAAILPEGQEITFIREENGVFLFRCRPDELAEFLKEWVLSFFLSPVLVQLQQRLSGFRRWNGIDAELADAKRKLLTAGEPYMRLEVPSRIELRTTGMFSFVKLPEDMRCKAYSNHPDIAQLGNGNVIKPLREGIASVTVAVRDHPEFSVTQSTTVYRFIEVARIQLSVSKNVVREGERLTVSSVFYPVGAHNTGQARWTVSPDAMLKPEPNGSFLALKPGRCSIRVTVGAVSEEVSVTIVARPTSVDFDQNDIAVKLGDTSQCVRISILPAGSQGGQVQYRISDPSILKIDSRNGQLLPIAEGDVIVTADLMDRGALVDSASCHVTVLPPKDIVTPDSVLIFLILSLLATAAFYTTPYRCLPGAASIVCAVWYAIRKKNKMVTVLSVILSLILCVLLFVTF